MEALLQGPRIKLTLPWSAQVLKTWKTRWKSPSTRFGGGLDTYTGAPVFTCPAKHINPGVMNDSCQGVQSPQTFIVQDAEGLTMSQIVRWLVLIPRSVPLRALPTQCRSQVHSGTAGGATWPLSQRNQISDFGDLAGRLSALFWRASRNSKATKVVCLPHKPIRGFCLQKPLGHSAVRKEYYYIKAKTCWKYCPDLI